MTHKQLLKGFTWFILSFLVFAVLITVCVVYDAIEFDTDYSIPAELPQCEEFKEVGCHYGKWWE